MYEYGHGVRVLDNRLSFFVAIVAAHGAQLLHAAQRGQHVHRVLVGGGQNAAQSWHALKLEKHLMSTLIRVGRLLKHYHQCIAADHIQIVVV